MAEQVHKKSENWRMFNRIAGRYDLLNRLLSLRRDVSWRKKLASHLPAGNGIDVLDVATGTADVLLTLCRNGKVSRATGVDMAGDMLKIGRRKIAAKQLSGKITLLPGNAMYLPLQDDSFDAVTIAFGIRNIPEPERALAEMRRILVTGGRALILEFSLPGNQLIRNLYLFYFRKILPRIGGMFSGDANAYRYLNTSVEKFPYGDEFAAMLVRAGFSNVRYYPLTFGIATIYSAEKTDYNPESRSE